MAAWVHFCSQTNAFSQKPIHLSKWMAELSPKPYTKSGVLSSQTCLLLSNPLCRLLEPVSDASAGVKMKGFCPGTGSVRQSLEEGKIEAWYMGQGKLLERLGVHRTAGGL